MENKPIVEVQQVSMKFNLASEKFDSFKEYFIKTLKKQISYNEFWALNDISFSLEKYHAENYCRCFEANKRKCDCSGKCSSAD